MNSPADALTSADQRAAVEEYREQAARRSERARLSDARAKTGVPTGAKALHPVTGAAIPIWIADYVLATYATGAVMAVQAAMKAAMMIISPA